MGDLFKSTKKAVSMIIDFHTHIFPSFFRDKRKSLYGDEPAFGQLYRSPETSLVSREALIRNMDEEGIHRSVIFGFPWEAPEHFRRHNDYIIESVDRHPDRLIGFCCFSPLAPQAARETERCLESNLSGVGELALYDSGITTRDIDPFKEIMDIAARFDAPLLLHTNEPVGHDYPGKTPQSLGQLYQFLKAYPTNRIVLAHWGGGLFFYALMKKEVKEVLANVWYDTAASPLLYTPEIYRLAGEIVGFEKILLGSDYPLLKPGRYLREMESADIASGSISKITGANAASLLGIQNP